MNLKTLRVSLNLTQAQMADKLNITPVTLSKYEREDTGDISRIVAQTFGVEAIIDQFGKIDYKYPNAE